MSPVVVALRRYTLEESLALRVHAGYRPRTGWNRRAACLGCRDVVTAAALCSGCPVRLDCLTATMRAEQGRPKQYIVGHMALSAGQRKKWQLPRPFKHGTNNGYQRHKRERTDPCQPCKDAHASHRQENKQKNRRNK